MKEITDISRMEVGPDHSFSGDVYRPPTGGDYSGGGGGGVTTVVVPASPAATNTSALNLNPGWNAGARSIEELPAGWVGHITFDIPDVGTDARPGGVAIGLCPADTSPTAGRGGYGHLRYGLIFTQDDVHVIHAGAIASSVAYSMVNGARSGGTTTDMVRCYLYGDRVRWKVNGLDLYVGMFSMDRPYVLDSVLYLSYDAVDNPKFIGGEWEEEEDSLLITLPPLGALFVNKEDQLILPLRDLSMMMSDTSQASIGARMPSLRVRGRVTREGNVEDSVGVVLPALKFFASDIANPSVLQATFSPLEMVAHMGEPGDVPYSALAITLPRMHMTATTPSTGALEFSVSAFSMRASSDSTYNELLMPFQNLRMTAYSGEMTPLVRVGEYLAYGADIFHTTSIAIAFTERVGGTATATVFATVTADGSEEITAQDTVSAMLTMLDAIAEQIGVGERLTMTSFSLGGGRLDDEGHAWAVNTESKASSRYENYQFNSFAAAGGRHFGVRQDGVYMLGGGSDAGAKIRSGVALGKHGFGTQSLKHVSAIYAGVSCTGNLFVKVGDGVNQYTYKARRNDPHMRVQRFDTGRGLRANYFTFDLVSDSAFELDEITFHVLPSARRI